MAIPRCGWIIPSGNGNVLTVGGKRYELTQFHFHRPSEERIHGKTYDMVLHLMHQGRDGKVVGVAVMLKEGRANPTIEQLWKHMPAERGQGSPDPRCHHRSAKPGAGRDGLLPLTKAR